MTREEISDFCVDQLADILHVPKESIDTRTNFARLGLDSAMSVYLVIELEEKFKLELDRDALVDHPTIEALSAHLADTVGAMQKAAG